MSTRISVIIPTYERREWIGRAIDSVLAQKPCPHEVIVVDDGSTDGTGDVLRGYGKRIRSIRRHNGGPAAARNTGCAAASGDWLAFLDSDDEWMPGVMGAHLHAVKAEPVLSVHIVNATLYRPHTGTVDLFAFSGFTPSSHVIERPLRCQIVNGIAWAQCALVHREALRRVGGFDEDFTGLYEDHDLFCRLALDGPWGVDERALVRILRRPSREGAVSDRRHTDPTDTARAMLRVYSKLAARNDLDADEEHLVLDKLAKYKAALGMALLKDGRRGEAREAFAEPVEGDRRMRRLFRLGLTYLPKSLVVRLLDAADRVRHG